MTALNVARFSALMHEAGADISAHKKLAVAVSGGPDSLALAHMLTLWCSARDPSPVLHVLSVDHALRAGSASEAAHVRTLCRQWPGVKVKILKWEHGIIETRILEHARKARYAMMAEYCVRHRIAVLFAAHHLDDQAETVLFRLAKGTGLDGLVGMRSHSVHEGVHIVRPLLTVPKADLVDYCQRNKIDFIHDPSNEADRFARVRLRQSWAVLEAEGLTSERLSTTAKRMARAQQALEKYSKSAWIASLVDENPKRIVFDFLVLKNEPEEIVLRCVMRAMQNLQPERNYPPRLEKTESVVRDLLKPERFRKRTLGGVLFDRQDKQGEFVLTRL